MGIGLPASRVERVAVEVLQLEGRQALESWTNASGSTTARPLSEPAELVLISQPIDVPRTGVFGVEHLEDDRRFRRPPSPLDTRPALCPSCSRSVSAYACDVVAHPLPGPGPRCAHSPSLILGPRTPEIQTDLDGRAVFVSSWTAAFCGIPVALVSRFLAPRSSDRNRNGDPCHRRTLRHLAGGRTTVATARNGTARGQPAAEAVPEDTAHGGAGVAPVELIPRIELRHSFARLPDGASLNATTARIDVDFFRRVLIRYELPFVRLANAAGEQASGQGDITLQAIGVVTSSPRQVAVLIAGAQFDTASQPQLGQGNTSCCSARLPGSGCGAGGSPTGSPRNRSRSPATPPDPTSTSCCSAPATSCSARVRLDEAGRGRDDRLSRRRDHPPVRVDRGGRLLIGRVGLFVRGGTQAVGPRQLDYTLRGRRPLPVPTGDEGTATPVPVSAAGLRYARFHLGAEERDLPGLRSKLGIPSAANDQSGRLS